MFEEGLEGHLCNVPYESWDPFRNQAEERFMENVQAAIINKNPAIFCTIVAFSNFYLVTNHVKSQLAGTANLKEGIVL